MPRVIRFTQPGGPDVLEYQNVEPPQPAAGEVRIKVKAIGLNRAEAMWREDAYIEPVTFPAGLGYEAVGTIDALGEGVSNFAVGDTVNTIPAFSMNQYGMYGEVVLAPIHAVVPHPPSLSHTEAASIWMMYLTAYGALIEDAKVGPGDTVLIPAASSSVGLAAIQLANRAGATSIALTRSSAKRQQLLDAGAHHVIASEEQEVVAEVLKLTNGQGARIVFDPVGGANLSKLIEAMAFQGTAYVYGALASGPTEIPLLAMIGKMLTLKGHNIWLTSGDPSRQKAAVEDILAGLASGALRPVIDRVFGFDEMVEAHRYLEQNGQFGKIVVTV